MTDNITSNFESLNEEDMDKFAGKWVAIIDNRVIISGNSFKEIYNFVKERYPGKRPLIGKIPEATPIILHSIK